MDFELGATDVIARYDALLADLGSAAVHVDLTKRITERDVRYGDRLVCNVSRPFFIRRDHFDALHVRATHVVRAVHRAARHMRALSDGLDILGLTSDERTLVGLGGGLREPDVLGRLDAVLRPDGTPVFLEYNGESPGGIAFGDALGDVFDETEPMRRLATEFSLQRIPVIPEVVDTLLATFDEWRAARPMIAARPTVGIVDLEGAATIREFEMFRDAFRARDLVCDIIDPRTMQCGDDGVLLDASGRRFDLVYRRLVTQDLLESVGVDSAFVTAARHPRTCYANALASYLYCHKGLFAVLSDPLLCPPDLPADERDAVTASVPWTRLVRPDALPTNSPFSASPTPLAEIVEHERERLVLKPCLDYGGRGVFLGSRETPESWRAAWETAVASGRWIVQEKIDIPTVDYPAVIDGEPQHVPMRFDLDPYVLEGRRTFGLGVRLSPDEVLNVAAGAGSAVPVYLVDS